MPAVAFAFASAAAGAVAGVFRVGLVSSAAVLARAAFDGGPYGISIHQRLVRDAADFLRPGGWLLFEFGQGQDRQVAALVARAKAYEPVSFATDEAGIPRVACVRRLGSAVSSVPPAANGT